MKNGGKRPGAGRPKGSKTAKTLDKEAARELVRQMVYADLAPLLAAQLSNAKGLKYLVIRDKKTGKFLRVTEGMARTRSKLALSPDEEVIEVWEKDPSVQAFTDLLNRALDKPKEQELEVKVTGMDELFARLDAGRKRNAARATQAGD